MKDARIVLDNEHNIFYPGQTLNGRIEYEFGSPKKVRGKDVILILDLASESYA